MSDKEILEEIRALRKQVAELAGSKQQFCKCGRAATSSCIGCNNYSHDPGPRCEKCARKYPCTFGHW